MVVDKVLWGMSDALATLKLTLTALRQGGRLVLRL